MGGGAGSCDLSELLHTGALENQGWGTKTPTSPVLRPFWLFSSSFGKGTYCPLISFPVTIFCTPYPVWFLAPGSFLSPGGRPTSAAPGTSGPVCSPEHNLRAEKCHPSCQASGSNLAHEGESARTMWSRGPSSCSWQRAPLPTEKTSQQRLLGPRKAEPQRLEESSPPA